MFRYNYKIRENTTDEELMHLICIGNQLAFETIYNRYFIKLVNFGKRLLFDDEILAEDIVQEVFLKIIDNPELFNKDKVFSTWVYSAVRNMCFNHTRNEQNRRRLRDENFQQNESTLMHSDRDLQMLKTRISEIFKTLSEKEKLIFVLRFEHNLSIKEIANIAGIPEGSVKSGIYYLLKKVAIYLKESNYEYK